MIKSDRYQNKKQHPFIPIHSYIFSVFVYAVQVHQLAFSYAFILCGHSRTPSYHVALSEHSKRAGDRIDPEFSLFVLSLIGCIYHTQLRQPHRLVITNHRTSHCNKHCAIMVNATIHTGKSQTQVCSVQSLEPHGQLLSPNIDSHQHTGPTERNSHPSFYQHNKT